MTYGKEQLKSMQYKLRQILNLLNDELPQYWWLSQGDLPIIAVRIFVYDGKKLSIKESPKLNLKAAVLQIIKNLEVAQQLKGENFRLAIRIMQDDLDSLIKIYSRVKDAHELVKKAEFLRRLLNTSKFPEETKREISEDINRIIMWIRDIFASNPSEFESQRSTLEKLLEKMEEKISS